MKKTLLAHLLFLSNAIFAHQLDDIKNRGVLRVAVDANTAPFAYVDEAGQLQGFEVELGKALSVALFGSEKVELIKVDIADRSSVVMNDKADITLAVFTKNKFRAKAVDFAEPYVKTNTGVLSAGDKPIKSLDELKDKTVITMCSSTGDEFFKKNHPQIKTSCYPDWPEMNQAFTRGEGVGLVNDNILLLSAAAKNKKLVVGIEALGQTDYIAPAIKKGEAEWLAWVNEEIKAMKKDGRLETIYQKTLSETFGDERAKLILDLGD